MISKVSQKTLVLVPGWATDHRVFGPLSFKGYSLLPLSCDHRNFNKRLLALMEEASLDRVSLLGWSLGGFLAADFASQNPYRVNELNLVSIREKYDPERLKEIKINLGKNKKAFLYRFYLECFAKAEKEELSWFKKRLLKAYTEEFTLDLLNEGLDYLSSARIDQRTFGGIKKVRFFHGEEDIVAPAREGERVSASVENSQWVCFPKTGHMPFLNASFHERFENG